MSRDQALYYVGATHVTLLAIVILTLYAVGWPLKGALLGGGLIGFAFVTFWVVARSLVEPARKPLGMVLGSLKVLVYLILGAAVLAGKLVADGEGFVLGVSCFVLATTLVALATKARHPRQVAHRPET